jgi:ribosomal protein S18 acetylase RimI-like enzyme
MPPDVKYMTPTEDDIPALVKAFAVAFSDYFIPQDTDEAHQREFFHVSDIDFNLSVLVVTPTGEPVGQAVSGRRGELGWIGGVGLRPDFRRKGIALEMVRRQLKAFREAGVHEVTLEVLSQNERAKRLYDGLGFQDVRDLYYFRSLSPLVEEPSGFEELRFEEAPIEQVLEFYTPNHPWQTMKESVSKLTDLKAFMSFRAEDGEYPEDLGLNLPSLPDEGMRPQGPELEGYCIYRFFEKGIMIVDLYSAGNPRALVSQLVRMTGGKPVYAHHVFDESAVNAFEGLDFERYLMQHEMSKNIFS